MKRLQQCFAKLRASGSGGLSAYFVCGHPDLPTSKEIMSKAIEAGAHWLELGIPFSDPAADGPVIEAATHAAVEAGVTMRDCLNLATELRAQHPDTPLIAMTYANLGFQMGWTRFAQALKQAGIDGCILPDVSLEESHDVRAALAEAGVAWIALVTPTTSSKRMASIAKTATGFLYVVGSVGTTGGSDPGPLVEATVARARQATDLPLVVGFGIASPEDVQRVLAAGADGAIVGSHLVDMVCKGRSPSDIGDRVAQLVAGTRQA